MIHSDPAFRILVEALRPDAGGEEASTRRRACTDWVAVVERANAHYVAPALYASLARAGKLDDLPQDARDYLELLHESNGRRNQALARQAEELIGAFNGAGIEPLLLKGGLSLFLGHYTDPAARMIRDIDLLVPYSARFHALEKLQSLDYRQIAAYPEGHHAYGDFVRDGDPGAVDLHFELIDSCGLLPAAEVRHRAKSKRIGQASFLAPSPSDQVLHNLLHAQIHYLGDFYRGRLELRQLYDFTVLARFHAGAVDWDWISDRLGRHGLATPLQSYALAAHRLFGLAWPLHERPSLAARMHLARCLLQLRFPALSRFFIPIANFRLAFAAHRLDELYGSSRSLFRRRLSHLMQFVRKTDMSIIYRRPFKSR